MQQGAQVDFYECACWFIHVVFFQPTEAHSVRTLQLSLSTLIWPFLFCVNREALLQWNLYADSNKKIMRCVYVDRGSFVWIRVHRVYIVLSPSLIKWSLYFYENSLANRATPPAWHQTTLTPPAVFSILTAGRKQKNRGHTLFVFHRMVLQMAVSLAATLVSTQVSQQEWCTVP